MGKGKPLIGRGFVRVSVAIRAKLAGSLRSVAILAGLLDEFLIGGFNDQFGDDDVLGELSDGDNKGGDILRVHHAGFLFVWDFNWAFV